MTKQCSLCAEKVFCYLHKNNLFRQVTAQGVIAQALTMRECRGGLSEGGQGCPGMDTASHRHLQPPPEGTAEPLGTVTALLREDT